MKEGGERNSIDTYLDLESKWCFKPGSAGKDTLDERWGDGVYIGMTQESSE